MQCTAGVYPRLLRFQVIRNHASAVWPWLSSAVAASLIVQLAFVRTSWFYLDDIRNLAQARQRGLTWGFLTSPIGEHLTPGHRFLDWVAAVPLGRNWTGAVILVLGFSAVMLCYLAGALSLLFGAHPRNAIPILLAGTAWPFLGTGQWFAGAALAIPVAAAIAGAIYHHLRWRVHGRRRDFAAALGWTVAGLLFSQQAILIAPLVFICALALPATQFGRRAVIEELVAVLPLIAPALALQLYVDAQPWSTSVVVPSITQAVDLVRAIVVRALLPALAGIGMDGAPPDPVRETAMRALATAGLAVALLLAVWLRRRWLAALVLAGAGAILTAVPIALARLGVGVSMSGSEPRYVLPAVLLGALAVGALLTRQPNCSPRALPALAIPAAAVVGIAWAGVYLANLHYTYRTRRVALDFGQASRRLATRLERGLDFAVAANRANAIVDGTLPFPLFYIQPSGNLRSAYSAFFLDRKIAAPGVPGPVGLLSIASDGAIRLVTFDPTGPSVTCSDGRSCTIPAAGSQTAELALGVELRHPASAGDRLQYRVDGPAGVSPAATLAIPAGATRVVIPATRASTGSVVVTFNEHLAGIRSVRAGVLRPPD